MKYDWQKVIIYPELQWSDWHGRTDKKTGKLEIYGYLKKGKKKVYVGGGTNPNELLKDYREKRDKLAQN